MNFGFQVPVGIIHPHGRSYIEVGGGAIASSPLVSIFFYLFYMGYCLRKYIYKNLSVRDKTSGAN